MTPQWIAEAWARFREQAIPAEASSNQIEWLETAFYAGATNLFNIIIGNLSPGVEATDDEVRLVNELTEELRQWLEEGPESIRKTPYQKPHPVLRPGILIPKGKSRG